MAILDLTSGLAVLARRTQLLRISLIVGLVLNIAYLVGQYMELSGTVDLDADVMTPATQYYLAVTIGFSLITVVTTAIFAMWIYRAAANVEAAAVSGFDYTPGWAVGWYFIPIANLFKPFQAMRQIWNASHGASGGQLDLGHGLLTAWWTAWITANIFNNFSALSANNESNYTLALQASMIGSFIDFATYTLAFVLVTRINAGQQTTLTHAEIFS